jgi:hypothetical protein
LGISQLSKFEFRWRHHVDLTIESARVETTVRTEVDAFRMIQAGLDFLNLMNIVTRQFSHTLQLPTHEDCAF